MNLEIEKYEGELRTLRQRVKDLEIELAWRNARENNIPDTWDEKTVEQDKYLLPSVNIV